MIHQPSGGFQGQASDIDIHAREVLKLREQIQCHSGEAHRAADRAASPKTAIAITS